MRRRHTFRRSGVDELLFYRSLGAYGSKKEISPTDSDIKFDCRLHAVSKADTFVSCNCNYTLQSDLLVYPLRSWWPYHESASFRTRSARVITAYTTVRREELHDPMMHLQLRCCRVKVDNVALSPRSDRTLTDRLLFGDSFASSERERAARLAVIIDCSCRSH